MALSIHSFAQAIPGKKVVVRILEDTIAGGRSVWKGEILEVMHEDYLALLAANKAVLHTVEAGAKHVVTDSELALLKARGYMLKDLTTVHTFIDKMTAEEYAGFIEEAEAEAKKAEGQFVTEAKSVIGRLRGK